MELTAFRMAVKKAEKSLQWKKETSGNSSHLFIEELRAEGGCSLPDSVHFSTQTQTSLQNCKNSASLGGKKLKEGVVVKL